MASSGDASDSICPKGWGIAGYGGDGSYQKLIANNYGMNKTNTGITQNYNEYDNLIRLDEILLQFLPSFMHSGSYSYGSGKQNNRQSYAYFWENRKSSRDNVWNVRIDSMGVRLQYATSVHNGYSVRCVAKFFR